VRLAGEGGDVLEVGVVALFGFLVGLACLARHAARCHGRVSRHALEVVFAQEADEHAVTAVIPGNAGNHGDLGIRRG
jgi:hypothetical protein